VYPIGQGIADKYTLDHRIFMGGDACHTHSVRPIQHSTLFPQLTSHFLVAQSRSRHEYRISRFAKPSLEDSSR
jgi:hypothetical protein